MSEFIPVKHFQTTRHSWFISRYLFEPIKSWLLDQNSLTRKVMGYCDQSQRQFRVQRLYCGMQKPTVEERQKLKLPARQWAYIREVMLCCDQHTLIYARTVIPIVTLKGRQNRLKFLKNRPLGAYLFAQPNISREPLEIARIKLPQLSETPLWARRSCFFLMQKPLLVYEIFLPQLWKK